jgi:leucyl-tRNA synthetase
VQGCFRFLSRFWNLVLELLEAEATDGAGAADAGRGRDVLRALHKTIRKVGGDIESFHFNTAVSAMMELQNEVLDVWANHRGALTPVQWREVVTTMTLLLSPMAPHIAEEIWQLLGHEDSVLDAAWPEWDEQLAADEVVTVVVQVNGKLRDRLKVPVGAGKDGVLADARAADNTARFLQGKQIVKEIYVPGKLVNFVVR